MRSLLTLVTLLATVTPSAGAQGDGGPGSDLSAAAPVPFGPGEKATFKVTYGLFGSVGEGVVEVGGVDTIRSRAAYHLTFRLKGGVAFWKANDRQESWLDVKELYSHRFYQNLNQTSYKRVRTLDFFPEQGIYKWLERDNRVDTLAVTNPLDDISFMYWARTLPLEVGKTYTFNRYYKNEGNPVSVRVLRRDSVKVDAGTFRTIVLKPTIKTDGLFSEGGQAELHFSDDDRRMLVFMSVKMSIGTLKLHLKDYQPGTQLSARRFTAPTS
jgi:hypothetical protein